MSLCRSVPGAVGSRRTGTGEHPPFPNPVNGAIVIFPQRGQGRATHLVFVVVLGPAQPGTATVDNVPRINRWMCSRAGEAATTSDWLAEHTGCVRGLPRLLVLPCGGPGLRLKHGPDRTTLLHHLIRRSVSIVATPAIGLVDHDRADRTLTSRKDSLPFHPRRGGRGVVAGQKDGRRGIGPGRPPRARPGHRDQ